MTWGAMVDTRRTIVCFFVVMFILVLSMFTCILTLAGSNVLMIPPASSVMLTSSLPFQN